MTATERDSVTPILALREVELRFVQPVDLAGRIANLLGAGLKTQVVHAVAGVDLQVRPGEVLGGAGIVITGSVVTAGTARTLFGRDPE